MNWWYSYDPEDGYDRHASADEAEAAADAALDYHRDRAGDGWHPNTSDIEWGLLVPYGEAREIHKRDTPGGEHDYVCDYSIVTAPSDDPLEAAHREIERLRARVAELEHPMSYMPPSAERCKALLALAQRERDEAHERISALMKGEER